MLASVPNDDYLTPREFAARYRISKMTVYRLIQRGDLAALKVGRQFRIAADQRPPNVTPDPKDGS